MLLSSIWDNFNVVYWPFSRQSTTIPIQKNSTKSTDLTNQKRVEYVLQKLLPEISALNIIGIKISCNLEFIDHQPYKFNKKTMEYLIKQEGYGSWWLALIGCITSHWNSSPWTPTKIVVLVKRGEKIKFLGMLHPTITFFLTITPRSFSRLDLSLTIVLIKIKDRLCVKHVFLF